MTARPFLAVAGDRAVDDRRVPGSDSVVADAEPVGHPWAEALDEDVRGGREVQTVTQPGVRLEVETDAALIAVRHIVQVRPHLPARFAARRLDRDDGRAEVGEHLGGIGSRDQGADVEYPQIAQRSGRAVGHYTITPPPRRS